MPGAPSRDLLRALEAHLREAADFNLSWTDGRRAGPDISDAYRARQALSPEEGG